jgi:hypothetical protein
MGVCQLTCQHLSHDIFVLLLVHATGGIDNLHNILKLHRVTDNRPLLRRKPLQPLLQLLLMLLPLRVPLPVSIIPIIPIIPISPIPVVATVS